MIAAAGIYFMGFGVRWLFTLFFGGHSILPLWIVAPGLSNATAVVAVRALVALVVLAIRGRMTRERVPLLRLMLVLLLGLLGLRVLDTYVLGTAISSGEGHPAIEGLALVAALLREMTTSGENVTNRGGRHLPRHSRVLLYLGYLTLVATSVLFTSALEGEGAEGQAFQSDLAAQFGIAAMGVPLLLTFFFVNLGAWGRRGQSRRDDDDGGVVTS